MSEEENVFQKILQNTLAAASDMQNAEGQSNVDILCDAASELEDIITQINAFCITYGE